jgi:hypothetical protein
VRRIIRISAYILLALVILVPVSVLALRLYFSDARLKNLLERKIGQSLDCRPDIGRLELSGWLSLTLEDITLSDRVSDSVFCRLDRLDMDMAPLALLQRRLHIRSVRLDGGYFDYDFPVSLPEAEPGKEGRTEGFSLPVKLTLDSCTVGDFRIKGSRGAFDLFVALEDVRYDGRKELELTYEISGSDGEIDYESGDIGFECGFDLSLGGDISTLAPGRQHILLNLNDIRMRSDDIYKIGNAGITGSGNLDINENRADLDELDLHFGDRKLLSMSGSVNYGDSPGGRVQAEPAEWEMAWFEDLAAGFGLPVKSKGTIAIEEGKFIYTSSGISYDFTLRIDSLYFDFGEDLKIDGLSGHIFSDGDFGQIIFGSSLMIDSVRGSRADGSSFSLAQIYAAAEAELSEGEYVVNLASGVKDFFGGKVNLSAFGDNSRIEGELRVSDVDLAEVSSGAAGKPDTSVFGLANLTVDIEGRLDSLRSVLRAGAEGIRITVEQDTMNLGDQDLEMVSSIVIRDEVIRSLIDYTFGSIAEGGGEIVWPYGGGEDDSLVVSFDMDIDNSLLPKYFPPSLAEALGVVDIFGSSGLQGRFASPRDSLAFSGKTGLTIRPTDLLIEDFQSLLSQIVSQSEIEMTNRGTDVTFNGRVGELYAEEYSDLSFPDINFEGEIVSTSDTTWRLTGLSAEIPSLNTEIFIAGEFGTAGDVPSSNFNVSLRFRSEEPVAVSSYISAAGSLSVDMTIEQSGDMVGFSGETLMEKIAVRGSEGFYCEDIAGRIPISGKINLGDSLLVVEGVRPRPVQSTYRRNRFISSAEGSAGSLTLGRISMGPVSATAIEADINFRDGVLEIPYISGSLLDGDFIGQMAVDFEKVNLLRELPNYEDLEYEFRLEMASLDFNQLVFGMGPFENRASFTADAAFGGQGIIARGEDYSIEGRMHISEMGQGVLDRVLDVIDPANENPAVAQTRDLLNKKILGVINASYRPTRFSFEIRHGSVYPSLYMDQPFFADVIPLLRVPMPVEYGRIPLKTIIDNLGEDTW